jgi:hypothetical protein
MWSPSGLVSIAGACFAEKPARATDHLQTSYGNLKDIFVNTE